LPIVGFVRGIQEAHDSFVEEPQSDIFAGEVGVVFFVCSQSLSVALSCVICRPLMPRMWKSPSPLLGLRMSSQRPNPTKQ
jgi:hypothetical protein